MSSPDFNYENSVVTAVGSLSHKSSDERELASNIMDDDINGQLLDEEKKFWATDSDKTLFWSSTEVVERIDPGMYKCIHTDRTGFALKKLIVSTDDLIEVPDSATEKVIDEVEEFWTEEIRKRYEERGFLHKRGVLMFGEPGSGKTSTIQRLVKSIISKGGIVLYTADPTMLTACLQMVRRIEPNRPIIVILEDFETLTDRERRENEWLSVLDGEAQVGNVVFLATTNYIESLDKRFTDRPSRFDLIVPVPMPSPMTRALFLRKKEPGMSLDEIKEWIENTKGFSIAHLKELIISVCIQGKDVKEEVKRLKKMNKREFSNDQFKVSHNKPGFGPSSDGIDEEEIDWKGFEKEYF